MNNEISQVNIEQRVVIDEVLNDYDINFSDVDITPLGNGHINQTYKVTTPLFEFVLQKINHSIFTKTLELCDNTEKINRHLLQQQKRSKYPFLVPKQLLTKSGKTYVNVGENYWRLMEFIKGSTTIETIDSPEQAALVANTFAKFSCALNNFNAEDLDITIDGFHDINYRIQQLKEAVKHNKQKRLSHCQSLVNFCFEQVTFINHVNAISKNLPLHVTHNDTKINNLLFDNTGQPCAVIDLDTCMPGFLMHDFGDMVRTCCSNLAEDDSNIDKMTLKKDVFHALIQGYQTAFADKMTSTEKESLLVGAKLLPFMIGVRFLTDHLNGDTYFNTNRKNQNLDRAMNQLHFYQLVCLIQC